MRKMKPNKRNLGFLALIVLIGAIVLSGSIGVCRGDGKEWPNLLPLSEGNEWEYKITIPSGGNFYYFRAMQYPPDWKKCRYWRGRLSPAEPGDYSLKYVITGEIEDPGYAKYWKVRIEKDSFGLYKDVKSVWWGMHAGTNKMKVEKLKFEPERYWEEEPISRRELLFENPEVRSVEGSIEREPPKRSITLYRLKRLSNLEDVSVAAGRFSNCWVFIYETPSTEEIEGEKTRIDFQPSFGWKTYSYYAPNIGLVKQYQEDSKGNRLYTMELVSYKIATYKPTVTPTPTLSPTLSPTPTPTLSPTTTPEVTPTPRPEGGVPGFEAVFAITGLLAVTYLLRRRK